MPELTPMQRVLIAFEKLTTEDFHKYIYDHGDSLLEEEEDLINGTGI